MFIKYKTRVYHIQQTSWSKYPMRGSQNWMACRFRCLWKSREKNVCWKAKNLFNSRLAEVRCIYFLIGEKKKKNKKQSPKAVSLGSSCSCCLEVEDAALWTFRPRNPPGRHCQKGSGISKPQLAGFISYLHFPLVLYIHVWIFQWWNVAIETIYKNAKPSLPVKPEKCWRRTANASCVPLN